jgi:predicted NAD-dependent protein-ADP-ribosyltransferase YbiA (DUF1768 family)
LNLTTDESKKLAKNREREKNTLFDKKSWESIRIDVMFGLVFQKFNSDKDLRIKLLATGTAYLEETNSWGDVIWGVCDTVGENKLGRESSERVIYSFD